MTGSPYGYPGPTGGPQDPGAPGWPPARPPAAPTGPYPPQYSQGYPQPGPVGQPFPQPAPHPYAQPYPPRQYAQHPQPASSFAPPPPPPRPQTPPPGSAPIGPPKPASMTIDSYKPPKRKVGTLVAFLVGFALLIGVFIAVDHFSRGTTTASDSPSATATATLPGLAFTGSSAKGVWEITDTKWSGNEVVLTLKVTVTSGTLRYSFYAYTNATAKVSYPETSNSTVLSPGVLSSGQSAQGTLTLRLSHADATLILADSTDTPLSGLAIKA